MKKIYFLFCLTIISLNAFSQNWLKNLPNSRNNEKNTFYDYQNAFNSYWNSYDVKKGYYLENGQKKKAYGWKQFKRWEYFMEGQIDPSTGKFPEKTAKEVYSDYVKSNKSSRSIIPDSANWKPKGPNSSESGYSGIGRINCVAFHPTDINTYWVGSAGGGLWVTANNGSSWTCLTDNNGVLAISDIIIPSDYATSKTIYIATGDKDGLDINSIGVLKSIDGGASWNSTGLSFSLSGYWQINKLLINPTNNQELLAATNGGLYKTSDGGTNWASINTNVFKDIEYNPTNSATIYGSNKTGSIFLSTNSGSTFTSVFANTAAARIELAVSPNQPGFVYAIASKTSDNGLQGIYKSTNSGASYTLVYSAKNLLGYEFDASLAGGQGWYDLAIDASPINANTLLIGGVNSWRSLDGGTTWNIVNHWWGDRTAAVHADKHMLKYRTNGDLFECNDGGIYLSTNGGTSWLDKTNGISISQMYKLSVSQTSSNQVLTGLQDNGTKLITSAGTRDVIGGDGMECIIDYKDTNVQYGSLYYGELYRTDNHWSSDLPITPSAAGQGAWVTPFSIDPINNQTLYAGYADLWKSMDRGINWTKISAINTSNKIRSIAIAPSNSQTIFIADLSKIWKTTTGGTSWTDITGTLPAGNGSITSIVVKNNDPKTLWVTLGGYNANRVYESIDGGTSWTDISTGLPSLPAYSIIQNQQVTSEVHLYLGTELGIYFKKGSSNWAPFNFGLPNVKIGEIEIYYNTDSKLSKLKAATYGRGLWETSLYNSSTIECNQTSPILSGKQTVCLGFNTTLSSSISGGLWSSSDSTIVSINSTSGILKANAVGNAVITYTIAGVGQCPAIKSTININVSAPVFSGTLSGIQSICQGNTSNFTSTVLGGIWSSSDTLIAKINASTGLINGINTGTAMINYKISSNGACPDSLEKSKLSITVNATPNAGILSGNQSICKGLTSKFSSSISGGKWSTTNDSIIVIDSLGIAKGIKSGTVNIVYTISDSGKCGSATSKLSATVFPNDAGTLTGLQAICKGSTTTFTSTISGGTWTSSNTAIATVNSTTGIVSGIAAGTVIISYNVTLSAACNNSVVSATRSITIVNPPVAGTLSGTQGICKGSTTTFLSTVAGGTWSSSNTSIATVNTSGLITGINSGTATIMYTVTSSGGCASVSTSRSVTVSIPNAGTLAGTQAICKGSTSTFTSTVTGGTWVSSNTSVASINSSTGLINGLSAGTATMTYTVKGTGVCSTYMATAKRIITVSEPANTGVLSGISSICQGTSYTFTSTVTGGKWSTSKTSIASVNSSTGLVTGIAGGTVNVIYSVTGTGGCASKSALIPTTILAKPSAGTTSGTTSIYVGGTSTFSSTVKGGTWISNNTLIADIGITTGIILGKSAGSTTMTYTVTGLNGCKSSASRSLSVLIKPAAQEFNEDNIGQIESNTDFSYNFYPNPTQGIIYLENLNPAVETILLMDITGKVIQTNSINNSIQTIDYSTVQPGIYLMEFKGSTIKNTVKQLIIN